MTGQETTATRTPPLCQTCGSELVESASGPFCQVCLYDVALDGEPAQETETGSWLDPELSSSPQDNYEIQDEIARGGMGIIYRARHRGLNRIVALKMILPERLQSAATIASFRAEAEAVAALDHPGILPIYEVGELNGIPFFSMKLAERGSLAEHIAEWQDRPREAARLIAAAARAVHHAHERGILHRDLKPGNILLGNDDAPFVTDFGIAKWLHRADRATIGHSSLGTPHYVAPEQAAGASEKLTAAADVYSLGAILYELLSGRPPFLADTALETLRLAADTAPAPFRTTGAAVPRDLEVICFKCLRKEPAERYASAASLAEDLERWLAGRTIVARRSSAFAQAWRWTKRNRAVAALSAALIVALIGSLFATRLRRNSTAPAGLAPSDKSIAVLPFADESVGKDQEYFCEGISEEILGALSKVDGLQVVARSSSFSFKSKAPDPAELRGKLNVSTVLTGGVRREGDRIRITTQLLDTKSGFYRWGETYERDLHDVFAVQNEITGAIVEALKIKLAVAPISPPAGNVEAYDLYLHGLYFSNKSSEEDLHKSLDLFQRALDKDPTFAPAWTGMAKTWLWLADEYVKPLEAYPAVKAAAEKAIALDEHEAEAHAYLGEAVRVLAWDYQAEESELHRALELDPNCAPAHLFLALLLSSTGSDDEAWREVAAAKRLDPLSPIVSNFIVELCLATNRFDNAVAEAQRMITLDPSYSYFDDSLAAAERERGQLNESIALYENAAIATQLPRPGLAIAYARAGRTDAARDVLARLLLQAKTRYIAADGIASIYVALGENDEAFHWLDRAVEEHAAPLEGIGRRVVFRPLHSDPRFATLLRRINLDPAKLLAPEKQL